MDPQQIEGVLAACEERLAGGDEVDLSSIGFWKAVKAVKRNPDLIGRFADRMAAIDREAFQRSMWIVLPIATGTTLAIIATMAGIGLAVWASFLSPPTNGVVLLAGFGVVVASSHGLGHLLVGAAQGMRFTHWFVASPMQPQPGVKVDYASYLRVAPARRAWMHSSGAIVSKLVPFIFLTVAIVIDAPGWTAITLLVIGVIQLLADALWSVNASDWKRFRRERSLASG